MRNVLGMAALLIGVASSLISCVNQSPPPQRTNPAGGATQLQPDVAVPSECHITAVYRDDNPAQNELTGIPWAKAEPTSSGIVASLFFAGTGSSKNQMYRTLHTRGIYPDGSTTKILWSIDNLQASDTVEITGKKLLATYETFKQTFPMALGPTKAYPSIVNVPTVGCWQFDIKSGSVIATLIFWVSGS